MSDECSLYAKMDIEREGSMSLCVVVNKSLNSQYCNDITSSCHIKEKRDIQTPVGSDLKGGYKGIQLEYTICKITNNEQAHWPCPFSIQHRTTMKVAKVQRKTNNIHINTSLEDISRDRPDAKDKDTDIIYFVYH